MKPLSQVSALLICSIGMILSIGWIKGVDSSPMASYVAATHNVVANLSATNVRLSGSQSQALTPVPTYAISGLWAVLNSASSNNSTGAPSFTFAVTNTGRDTLAKIEVLTLGFFPNGTLASVENQVLKAPIAAGQSQGFFLNAEAPHISGNTYFMTIKSATDVSGRIQDLPSYELIRALAEFKSKGVAPALKVEESRLESLNLVSNYCYSTVRLAHNLAGSDGQLAVKSNYCDQFRRTFNFSFVQIGRK